MRENHFVIVLKIGVTEIISEYGMFLITVAVLFFVLFCLVFQ